MRLVSSVAASWSVVVRVVGDPEPKVDVGGALALRTASVGKLLLLTELAAQLESGEEQATTILDRRDIDPVGGTGLWQRFTTDTLTVADAAVLVGAHSDNLATNALLHRVGLAAVTERTASLGMLGTGLLDIVRDWRDAGDPPTFSAGTAADWASFAVKLATGTLVSPAVTERVCAWMAGNGDLSLVASSFSFDPLHHNDPDEWLTLRNKTGSDTGVRAEVGYLAGERNGVAYAAIANWDEREHPNLRPWVRADMREIGETVRRLAG